MVLDDGWFRNKYHITRDHRLNSRFGSPSYAQLSLHCLIYNAWNSEPFFNFFYLKGKSWLGRCHEHFKAVFDLSIRIVQVPS